MLLFPSLINKLQVYSLILRAGKNMKIQLKLLGTWSIAILEIHLWCQSEAILQESHCTLTEHCQACGIKHVWEILLLWFNFSNLTCWHSVWQSDQWQQESKCSYLLCLCRPVNMRYTGTQIWLLRFTQVFDKFSWAAPTTPVQHLLVKGALQAGLVWGAKFHSHIKNTRNKPLHLLDDLLEKTWFVPFSP